MGGPAGPGREPEDASRGRLSWRDRLAVLERRVRRSPPVRGLLAILDAYNSAGGGLVASGLAFSALFAVVPGLLLVVSVVVVLVDDSATRATIVDWIVTQVPPLQDVARAIVEGLADGARVGSVVGAVAFLWGASGFYLALERTMDRAFPGTRGRVPMLARLRGAIATVVVVGAVLLAFLVSSALSVVWRFVPDPPADLLTVTSLTIAIGVATVVCGLVYRIVPGAPPSVRAAAPAALLAGVAIGVLTALFSLLAPFLIRGFAGLGVVASVFIALVWFQYVFGILLYGAAFARLQRDRERSRNEAPTL